MSLTRDESRLMDSLFATGNDFDAQAVRAAGDAVLESLRASDAISAPAQDDRRAALDAAIYRYMLACN